MHILIIYGSLEGQTKKIAHGIGDRLQLKGHDVTVLAAEHLPAGFTPRHYDAAIVGGAIHMNHYPRSISDFVTSHLDWLRHTTTGFFTVCMAIRSEHQGSRNQALAYSEDFLKQTGWRPARTATFAGAVKYTQYNFLTRYIMKRISKHEGGSTDTSRDHEYTDWASVERFADDFNAVMENRLHEREISQAT